MQTEWAIVMHRVPPWDTYAASPNVRFGSKADMCSAKGHVRFTPKSGHVRCTSPCLLSAKSGLYAPQRKGLLFDHLVGTVEQRPRHCKIECFGSLEIDHQLELGGLLNRQVAGL